MPILDRAWAKPEGVILVAVLWLVLLLSLLASMLVTAGRQDIRSRKWLMEKAAVDALADAGIKWGILALVEPRSSNWSVDGEAHEFKFQGRSILVSIQDEAGKIDLNTAQAEILERLFLSNGINREKSRSLVDSIADWRDLDTLRRLNGAELGDYRAAGLVYGPRNSNLQSVKELALVKGMTRESFRQIEEAVTVYSQLALPDLQTAPIVALWAVPGMDGGKAEEFVRNRRSSATQTAGLGVALARQGMADADRIGRAFTIRAEIELENGAHLRKEAVIRLTGDPRRPYWVHAWR